jgi:hypothetical protein
MFIVHHENLALECYIHVVFELETDLWNVI